MTYQDVMREFGVIVEGEKGSPESLRSFLILTERYKSEIEMRLEEAELDICEMTYFIRTELEHNGKSTNQDVKKKINRRFKWAKNFLKSRLENM